MRIETPVSDIAISKLKIYDTIEISGMIYTGRDAVLPKLVEMFRCGALGDITLDGSAVFHTAVSSAGIGPTSSNKLEIEESIAPLSEAGVRIHIGKGRLKPETADALYRNCSIFVVTPPTGALFSSLMKNVEVAAFPELGIEALHQITVKTFPAIVAIANGKSIFDGR